MHIRKCFRLQSAIKNQRLLSSFQLRVALSHFLCRHTPHCQKGCIDSLSFSLQSHIVVVSVSTVRPSDDALSGVVSATTVDFSSYLGTLNSGLTTKIDCRFKVGSLVSFISVSSACFVALVQECVVFPVILIAFSSSDVLKIICCLGMHGGKHISPISFRYAVVTYMSPAFFNIRIHCFMKVL